MSCATTTPLLVALVEILKACLFFMLVLRVQMQENEACKFNQSTIHSIYLLIRSATTVMCPTKIWWGFFLQSAVIALWF